MTTPSSRPGRRSSVFRLLAAAAALAGILQAAPARAVENGDIDGNSERDISDPVQLLLWLFSDGPAPVEIPCVLDIDCSGEAIILENGDVDGDGSRDITDAIGLLGWIFLGARPPEPICFCRPFEGCGPACAPPYACVPSGPSSSICTSSLKSCEEVESAYFAILEGFGKVCDPSQECRMLWGHCGIGLGGCHYSVNTTIRQEDLDALAARFQELGCTGPVCRCPPMPKRIFCDGAFCELEY